MHADEHRVRVNKVEFDVPAIALDDVDLDRRNLVVRRDDIIMALASLQHLTDLVERRRYNEWLMT